MDVFNLKQLLYNPAGWVYSLSGFRGGQNCCRRQLWYTGLEGHVLSPAEGINMTFLPWKIALITGSNHILGYLLLRNRWAILRKNCNWGTQESIVSLIWGSLVRITVKLNSDSHVLWQHSALHPTAQSPRINYTVPLGRLPDILHYLHFTHCYFL